MLKIIEAITGIILGVFAIVLSVITNAGLACIVAASLLTFAFIISLILEIIKSKK